MPPAPTLAAVLSGTPPAPPARPCAAIDPSFGKVKKMQLVAIAWLIERRQEWRTDNKPWSGLLATERWQGSGTTPG